VVEGQKHESTKMAWRLCAFLALCAPVLLSGGRAERREATYEFRLARAAEVALRLRASAPGTSWQEPGAEAAVVRLELDGRYNQHVTLFHGAQTHEYRLLLGALGPGGHRLRARLDRKLSSRGADRFEAEFALEAFEPGSSEYQAIRRAPILSARPDTLGRATDTPLLAYYEWLPAPPDAPAGTARKLQYTYIFSNEDGGTNTTQLMARWGRTVDTEYVYYLLLDEAGNVLREIIQGVNHKETPFRGKRMALHPLIGVASKNNIFSGRPASRVRMALWPEPADLSQHSREELLDRHPWTYRIMAQELEREGKLKEIADPRRFLYIEAHIRTSGAAASFGVALKDGRVFRSDRDRADLRIERSGWVRSALELPAGTALADIAHLLFHCHPPAKPPRPEPAERFCSVTAIPKFFFLDENYRPGPANSVQRALPARLSPGQDVSF